MNNDLSKKIVALYDAREYENGLRLINEEERIYPNDFDMLSAKAAFLGALGRYDDSICVADRIISTKKADYITFYNKGVSLYCLEKFPDSVAAFQQCLALKPNYIKAIKKNILALLICNRLPEAIILFEGSDLPDSDSEIWHNNLGYMYLESGDYPKAGTHLYKSKALNSLEKVSYYNLARLWWRSNDIFRFVKYVCAFAALTILENTHLLKLINFISNNRGYRSGDRKMFSGSGKLFKTLGQARETQAILKLMRGPNASALSNDFWAWRAINIPYQAVNNNGFGGDIDIIIKRPRDIPELDAGFTYRGFQVKTVVVNKFGLIRSAKRGFKKHKDIKKQLDILKEFGCEQIFLLELFILERGYSSCNDFPSEDIRSEIDNKKKFLQNLGYGYVVVAEEPSAINDDETGGIAHRPLNILPSSSHLVGNNFQILVDSIDDVYNNSRDAVVKNSPLGEEPHRCNVGYCQHCHKIIFLVPVDFATHICSFCGQKLC